MILNKLILCEFLFNLQFLLSFSEMQTKDYWKKWKNYVENRDS